MWVPFCCPSSYRIQLPRAARERWTSTCNGAVPRLHREVSDDSRARKDIHSYVHRIRCVVAHKTRYNRRAFRGRQPLYGSGVASTISVTFTRASTMPRNAAWRLRDGPFTITFADWNLHTQPPTHKRSAPMTTAAARNNAAKPAQGHPVHHVTPHGTGRRKQRLTLAELPLQQQPWQQRTRPETTIAATFGSLGYRRTSRPPHRRSSWRT